MSRLPFLFIVSGIVGFIVFHVYSLFSLSTWITESLRGPTGWFHVHLFVLGWATMLAMGAIYQLINVILQSKIYSEKLGYAHYAVFTIGLIGLVYGFLTGQTAWISTFATIAILSILIFGWNMAMTIIRAKLWNSITISAATAILYLILTGISGLTMGLNFAFGFGNEIHNALFGTHIWLGTVGWFGLLITGFSYKMLPMFYLSHNYPTRLQFATTVLWNVSVLVGVYHFLLQQEHWSLLLALFILIVAIIIYNVHLLQVVKHRHKKNPGAGIRWTMVGNQAFASIAAFLLLYVLLFEDQLFSAEIVRLVAWVYLGGWVSFMIVSYASKIVPFLWWTYKYGHKVGQPGTPVMSNMLNEKWAFVGLAAIAISSFAVIVGLFFDVNAIIAIAGIAYSIFSLAYIALISYVFAK